MYLLTNISILARSCLKSHSTINVHFQGKVKELFKEKKIFSPFSEAIIHFQKQVCAFSLFLYFPV